MYAFLFVADVFGNTTHDGEIFGRLGWMRSMYGNTWETQEIILRPFLLSVLPRESPYHRWTPTLSYMSEENSRG